MPTKELETKLLDFIHGAPTAYHAVLTSLAILQKQGFRELSLGDKWIVEKQGKYYINILDSAFIAFKVGDTELAENGFRIIGAHNDAPTFRIKPNAEIRENGYLKLNTEPYGSPILSTWFDRPLSIAGRVITKGVNPLKPRVNFVNLEEPLLIIPNLAIHLNRTANDGIKYNNQKDLLPVLTLINEKLTENNCLIKLLAQELNVLEEAILDFDLYLYENERGKVLGLQKEFISASRLDDLQMVFLGLEALNSSEPTKGISLLVCFDNEEIGSRTKQGADSPLLANILERICLALGKNREDFHRAVVNSFLISADMAHAIHPNASETNDLTNKPKLNGGPVLKFNANYNYATDAYTGAVIEQLAAVEYQINCPK